MQANIVGDAVRTARESVNYTVDDLAETCGLTVSEITLIEGGEEMDHAKLARIAAALQVSLHSLTG
jgi:transcriptional regulator with XRE-family HTH domain